MNAIDRAYEMAGLARQDGDKVDELRYLNEAHCWKLDRSRHSPTSDGIGEPIMKYLYTSLGLLTGEAMARIAAQETSTSDQGTVTVHQAPPRRQPTNIQTHQSPRAGKTYASNGARERERRMRKLKKEPQDE